MRLKPLLRSSAFRLTLLYAAVFELSVAVLFAVIYWGTQERVRADLDQGIERELAVLLDTYRFGGLPNLVVVLAERTTSPEYRTNYFYLLQTGNGRRLAGNVGETRLEPGWSIVLYRAPGRVGEPDRELRLRLRTVKLPNGLTLAVGQSFATVEHVHDLIVTTFLWCAVVTLVLAIAGGALLSARFLRRVEEMEKTTREIIDGRFDLRLVESRSGDEFGRLAANVNRMLDRIETLLENLRQATNDIAHDLRTPVARLRQRLEGMRLKAATRADYERAIDQAIADVDGILATFSALLRIAQIESGTRRAGFSEVDLSAVFATLLEFYLPAAEDRGQKLAGTIAPGIAFHGDRELLTQMVSNLIENAIRHTQVGSRIELSLTGPESGGPATAAVPRSSGSAIGIVADSGPGIPAEHREKVFRRFYRLDQSRSTPGSGLGLSLAAAVAHFHGIAIELDDNHPGLRVTLRFPDARHAA